MRFVFTGRITREKGVFDLLEVMSDFGLNKESELLLAGEGPDFKACQAFIITHQIKNVKLLGTLAKNEIRDLLESSSVLVLPSYHEGFPNSILEAMAVGLPVIATAVGAIPESIQNGKNGIVVKPHCPDDLAKAMRAYIDDPSLIAAHSAATLDVVLQRHNREKNIQFLLDQIL